MIIKVLIVFFIVYFLIFIHEFGHYLAAIRNGVRVDEFSIGFPPKLISFKKGGTRFSFALLPLGGYVKLHGDNAETGSDAKITKSKAFYAKTPWQKIKILLAGVLMNFLVYAILMTGAYTLGVPRFIQSFDVLLSEINDRNIVVEQGLKITDVVEGSEADGKVQLSDRVLYAEKEFFIPSLDLEFENLSDLNDFGVNLNNFFLLPSLRSLNDSNFFKEAI